MPGKYVTLNPDRVNWRGQAALAAAHTSTGEPT